MMRQRDCVLTWSMALSALVPQAALSAPPVKPTAEILDLDRARLSGDKHLIWFRLKTKANPSTILDVCFTESNKGETNCSQTVTLTRENESQGVFVIYSLTPHTSLSLRAHNSTHELAVAKLSAVQVWDLPTLFAWLVVALLAASPMLLLWWQMERLKRQLALRPSTAPVDVAHAGHAAVQGELQLLTSRVDGSLEELRAALSRVETTHGAILPAAQQAESAIALLDGKILEPRGLLVMSTEQQLQPILWLAMKAWFSDPALPLAPVLAFASAHGAKCELVDLFYADGAYDFKANSEGGKWLLVGIPDSADKLLCLLARKPTRGFERLKELVGVESAGVVVEMERPCRLKPASTPGRYVVRSPGSMKMGGPSEAPEGPADRLAKRLNAALQLKAAAAGGSPTLATETLEAQQALARVRAYANELEHRLAELETRLLNLQLPLPVSPAVPHKMAATAGIPVTDAAVPSAVAEPAVPHVRKASVEFSSFDSAWWSPAVAEAWREGGSPDDYLVRVVLLCQKLQDLIAATNSNYTAALVWVRWGADEKRFLVHRGRTSEAGVFAQEPGRPERQLVGRELFQLFVAIEDKSRKALLLFVPAGAFSVDQHPTVLTQILENPPEGAREIRSILYAAEMTREKAGFILNEGAKLVFEYRTDEDELVL